MKIYNIVNNRDKAGYFYSSENYHPITHHLPIEPWIGGQWLRMDEEIVVPDKIYLQEKDFLEGLKQNRIIDFEVPSEPPKEEMISEKTALEEKPKEKTIDLGDLSDSPTKFSEATTKFTQLVTETPLQTEFTEIVYEAPEEKKEDTEKSQVEVEEKVPAKQSVEKVKPKPIPLLKKGKK